jgi:hypothetical protein
MRPLLILVLVSVAVATALCAALCARTAPDGLSDGSPATFGGAASVWEGQPGALDVRGLAQSADGLNAGKQAFSQPPPFSLPPSLQPQGYEAGRYVESWRAVSDEPCRDVAKDLLTELRSSGFELVEAGYLDLFGEAWGCTLKGDGAASLTITLIPARPLQRRSADNPLQMVLVWAAMPQQLQSELSQEGVE